MVISQHVRHFEHPEAGISMDLRALASLLGRRFSGAGPWYLLQTNDDENKKPLDPRRPMTTTVLAMCLAKQSFTSPNLSWRLLGMAVNPDTDQWCTDVYSIRISGTWLAAANQLGVPGTISRRSPSTSCGTAGVDGGGSAGPSSFSTDHWAENFMAFQHIKKG